MTTSRTIYKARKTCWSDVQDKKEVNGGLNSKMATIVGLASLGQKHSKQKGQLSAKAEKDTTRKQSSLLNSSLFSTDSFELCSFFF